MDEMILRVLLALRFSRIPGNPDVPKYEPEIPQVDEEGNVIPLPPREVIEPFPETLDWTEQSLWGMLVDVQRVQMHLEQPTFPLDFRGKPGDILRMEEDPIWEGSWVETTIREREPQTEEMRTTLLVVGRKDLSVDFLVNQYTTLCYDCDRPLGLFLVSMQEERPAHQHAGWCPRCLLLNRLRKEARQDMQDARREGRNSSTEAVYFQRRLTDFIQSSNLRHREWWSKQKETRSPLYTRWRERWISSTSIGENSPPSPGDSSP